MQTKKIQELQDRKKINRLLSLAGVNEHEITYFIKEPPGKLIVEQKYDKSASTVPKKAAVEAQPSCVGTDKYPRDYECLLLQINSLETQIAEMTKHSREQVDALLEDRKVSKLLIK